MQHFLRIGGMAAALAAALSNYQGDVRIQYMKPKPPKPKGKTDSRAKVKAARKQRNSNKQ